MALDRLAIDRPASTPRAHDDLSLTGAVAPIADDDAMVGELVARISGFGPLQPFLDDPEAEEVWINSPRRVRHSSPPPEGVAQWA